MKADLIGLVGVERDISIPMAFLENEDLEMPIPEGRLDIVVNPIDFEEEVRNEDYRYHRLPMGVLPNLDVNRVMSDAFGRVSNTIAHGDGKGEGLLFPVLYPYGRGFWQYRRARPMPTNPK